MGVVTITDIDYGQTFGPFPVSLAMADPAYMIGLLTVDRHRDGVVLKVNIEIIENPANYFHQ